MVTIHYLDGPRNRENSSYNFLGRCWLEHGTRCEHYRPDASEGVWYAYGYTGLYQNIFCSHCAHNEGLVW